MKINNNLLISGRGEGEGGRGGGGDKSDWLTEYQAKLVNFSNEHPFGICGQGVQYSVGDRVYSGLNFCKKTFYITKFFSL